MERKSMEEINREGEKKVSCAHGYVEWPVTVRGRRRNWKGAWLADALHEPSITGIQSASRQKGGEWWEEEEKKKSQMARESYNRLKASDIAHGWEPSSLFPSEKIQVARIFVFTRCVVHWATLPHTRGDDAMWLKCLEGVPLWTCLASSNITSISERKATREREMFLPSFLTDLTRAEAQSSFSATT